MNGAYRLIIQPSARRDLGRFSGNIPRQLEDAIQELAAQPRGVNTKKLHGARNNEINDTSREIVIHQVVDRKDAY